MRLSFGGMLITIAIAFMVGYALTALGILP